MTVEVPLSKGFVALIDDEDAEVVLASSWHALITGKNIQRVYAYNRHRGLMHRLILGFPDGDVDHRNDNTLDNRQENLRVATRAQNIGRKRCAAVGASGYRGVTWDRTAWVARIRFEGKKQLLGRFLTPQEAAMAYDEMAKQVHGEFARLNFEELR